MTKDEILKMAHHALELANYYVADYCNGNTIEEIDDAITAIKEALAQPEQEPVAWMHPDGRIWTFGRGFDKSTFTIPLYTTPPPRKPLPPQSPCEMTQAERRMFKLGWLECEAAHGIKE